MPHPIIQFVNAARGAARRQNVGGRLLLVLCLITEASQLFAEDLTIAVASNFASPMREIGQAFEQKSGHNVRFAFGSSGKLASQILQGAPFDAFFSADQSKPALLRERGFASQYSQFTYAIGRLALWSKEAGVEPLAQLRAQQYRKVALANPKLAPYGDAAQEVLGRLGLLAASQSKWVQGENIAQTYQFVDSGNAELGFVAYSQIYKQNQLIKGSAWLVPENLHQPIRQDAVLVGAESSEAARQFMGFMRGSEVRTILESYGYQPDKEKGKETAL